MPARRGVGLAVDEVLDVAELPPARRGAPRRTALRGTALVDGALVGAIDLAAVLDALEAELAA